MYETDEKLLALAQAEMKPPGGRYDAFERLLQKYERLIYSVAYRYLQHVEDARDLSQEAIIKIYRNLPRITLPPEKAGEPDALKAWICAVTANTCLDALRKHKRMPSAMPLETPGLEAALPVPPGTEETVTARERVNEIMTAVNRLPDDFKTMIILRDMHGLSYQALAEAVQIPVNTVKSRLSRARAALKKMLE